MSFVDDLKNIDPNNPGEWPFPVQMLAMAIVLVVILFLGYKFDISTQRETIAGLERKEVDLKGTFERKQKKAANLDALKEQMKEMQQSFGDMLKLLPNRTEIPALIVDISQEGLAAGLVLDAWKTGAETPAEFYAEKPIQLTVRGNYHQLGEFISGVAGLPRIVTTHNLNIKKADGTNLQMSAVAKTYRALDEEE